ncbi:MAG: hypothetical protein GY758_26655 [Fuerstiella sp.]|nr:hypothetical protein [Fuerstiella sp.]MCP4787047.1 hypothetical protein [Fuerstiella sp.]MCP4858885.1 hypothetical protein [Fuerstiella sp.]
MNHILVIAALVGWLQLLSNEVTVSAILFLCIARFLHNLDKRPAVLEIAALIAVLQFIAAAVLMYRMGNDHSKYHMYVDEQTYFSYAIPATCCLLFGLFVQLPGTIATFKAPTPQVRLNSLGIALVVSGFLCSVSVNYAPVQVRFVFFLLAQLRYVGVLYLYFNKSSARWAATGLVCLSLIADSTRSGMFHELLLWGTLLPAFYFLARPPSMKLKVLFLASVVCAVASIQLVKHEYRELLWSGRKASLSAVFLNTLAKGSAFGREWQEGLVMRVNQGWIVSAAMNHVPLLHGFANGETIREAVVTAIVPRILNDSKRTASGSDNTEEFTGLQIWGNTTMALSPLGEAYVNFAELGGCAVMLCFGLMLNLIYHWLLRLGHIDQYFVFVIPLVFLQAIKMETEFLTVFNHLVKSSILVVGLYYVFIRDPRPAKHSRRPRARKTANPRSCARSSRAASVRTAVR